MGASIGDGQATGTITNDDFNDTPVAADDSYSVTEDSVLTVAAPGVLGNDTDADGDPLTAQLVTGPADGTLGLNADGSFTYTPDADFDGADSFTYSASDGGVVTRRRSRSRSRRSTTRRSRPTTATARVRTRPCPCRRRVCSATTRDVDGDTLAAQLVTAPAQGTLTLNADGSFTYTPPADFSGPVSFTYQASDGSLTSATATVSITVASVNDPPSFVKGPDDSVLEDSGARTINGWATGISPGPADEAGQTVVFQVSNDNASLFSVQPAVASDGTLTYTSAPDAFGSATVTVVAQDSGGATSAPQTFVISVTPVNDAPSFDALAGDPPTVNEDATAQTVAGFATGMSAGPANESSQTLTFVVTNNSNPALFVPVAGLPTISPSGTLTYTPAPNANGTATITIELTDDGGTANGGDNSSPPQTFTITVTSVNDPPSFTGGGNVTVNEDSGPHSSTWATAISAGPPDESGQSVTFTVSNDNNGLFSAQPAVAPDGTLTFTPAADAFGTANVSVTARGQRRRSERTAELPDHRDGGQRRAQLHPARQPQSVSPTGRGRADGRRLRDQHHRRPRQRVGPDAHLQRLEHQHRALLGAAGHR